MSTTMHQVTQGATVLQVQTSQPMSTDEPLVTVTDQLPVQSQVAMAQPTQPPIQEPGVQPQPQVVLAQGPQVLPQQPVVMGVPPQQVPQLPVQYVQQPAYGQPQAVAYTAQPQPGVPQFVLNPVFVSQPDFNYTPNSYFILSLVMAVLCGIFSPVTLVCSVPSVFLSLKSMNSIKTGNIKQAHREGLYALALIIVEILVALIVAIIFTGIFIAVGRTVSCYNYSRYYYSSSYHYYNYYC